MDQTVKQRISDMVASKDVFLFMKGTPQAPMCGFSAGVTRVLQELQVDFASFNVLNDETIRQGIKEYADWPTIPQLYIKGEFIGGHDIVTGMAQTGELQKKLTL